MAAATVALRQTQDKRHRAVSVVSGVAIAVAATTDAANHVVSSVMQ